jgi:hypothetical protein
MSGRYVSPDIASIEREWQIGRGNSNPFRQSYLLFYGSIGALS